MKKIIPSIKILTLACLVLPGFLACTKVQEEPATHEMTEQEQKKQHLEDSFSAFVQKIDLESSDNVWSYLLQHSSVALGLDGSIIYTLNQDREQLLRLKFRFQNPDLYKVDGNLYGGLALSGFIQPLSMILDCPDKRENHMDIHILDNGEDVAKLGLELYEKRLVPVFRFPDGTSYSVTTVILISPLLDYLLEYVLSTE